jgi:hypothetical protein
MQYNWKRGKITAIDAKTATVQIQVTLAPTDIVWGFYPYQEPDIVYNAIDCNPFTNPAVRNCIVQFYYRTDSDPMRSIYHQVFDAGGTPATDQTGKLLTNDPNPPTYVGTVPSTGTVFSQLMVGSSIGADQFTVTDIRQRGGGVAPQYLGTPLTYNLWDSCYWDGKPYPIGSALAVYLPQSILGTQSRDTVQAVVQSVLPAGVLPVIHYYDPATGEESV